MVFEGSSVVVVVVGSKACKWYEYWSEKQSIQYKTLSYLSFWYLLQFHEICVRDYVVTNSLTRSSTIAAISFLNTPAVAAPATATGAIPDRLAMKPWRLIVEAIPNILRISNVNILHYHNIACLPYINIKVVKII